MAVVDFRGESYDVSISSGYAYVANRSGGLGVADVSTPTAPLYVGRFDTPGLAYGLDVAGGYVYLADGEAGMPVFRDCAVFFADGFEEGDTSLWSSTFP